MLFFFFKQKTAYEMRISDWSSDVCSSDLWARSDDGGKGHQGVRGMPESGRVAARANPPRGRFRNHLPVDAQVPAGLGTAQEQTARFAPSGCPGVFGPVPPPASLELTGCPRFFRMSIEIGRASCRARVCQYG